jgi:N-acetylglucosamine-6-phosphate deacetylase
MSPLHHRDPGLAGLITLPYTSTPPPPYYTILTDGLHIHPSVVTLLYRAAPQKCILISDSIELTGLPDGTYPGHAQIPHPQLKQGNRVTIAGTDTLIGATSSVDEGVRNLIGWTGCSVAEAVRCVTENVADFMGLGDRGVLQEGRRADFAVLSEEGEVLETWVEGKQVWRAEGRKAYA